jgi:microcompartment protein CcmL/EutN
MKSLGFVEVSGVVAAVDALDIMCKSSNVTLVTWERKLGGRLVTIIVTGSVSDVTEAVECVKNNCVGKPCASVVIANPHEETIRMVELSASRLKKNTK